MSEPIVAGAKGTAYYGRKANLGNYESEEAGVYLQFDDEGVTEDFLSAASQTLAAAKSLVLAQLGQEAAAVAQVKATFKGAVEEPAAAPATTNPARQQPSSGGDEVPPCPDCNGGMWDNRGDKASGKAKPNYPDFKCKDKDGCGKAVWLQKKGGR